MSERPSSFSPASCSGLMYSGVPTATPTVVRFCLSPGSVPSACTVDGKPLADLLPADTIEELVTRTRNGGAEVVALLKTGSAYYAPSAAAARMARAVKEDSGAVLPVCAWVDGEYGISGVYLGVEAEIGAGGVRRIVERDLTDTELAALREAAEAVRAKQADVADM